MTFVSIDTNKQGVCTPIPEGAKRTAYNRETFRLLQELTTRRRDMEVDELMSKKNDLISRLINIATMNNHPPVDGQKIIIPLDQNGNFTYALPDSYFVIMIESLDNLSTKSNWLPADQFSLQSVGVGDHPIYFSYFPRLI